MLWSVSLAGRLEACTATFHAVATPITMRSTTSTATMAQTTYEARRRARRPAGLASGEAPA